jgi:hypothetical protein
VILEEARPPAGVVDDDVEEDARASLMGTVGEFAELVDAVGSPVELDQGGIEGGEVEGGVRASEAPETRVDGGGRVDGKKVQNPAAQPVDDVRQLAGEVPEGSGRREDGIAAGFEVAKQVSWPRARAWRHAGGTQETGERAVDGVGGSGPSGWMLTPKSGRRASLIALRIDERPWPSEIRLGQASPATRSVRPS